MKRFLSCLLLVVVAGCGNADKTRLKRGCEWAVDRLDDVNRNPAAAIAFGSQAEMGGDVTTYLISCLPENYEDFPNFSGHAPPEKPWTVVVKPGPGANDYTIEGYGTDLEKPIMGAKVTIKPKTAE